VSLKFIEIKDAKETVLLTKAAQTSSLDIKTLSLTFTSSRAAAPTDAKFASHACISDPVNAIMAAISACLASPGKKPRRSQSITTTRDQEWQ
jgi:hypothetical protein